MILVENNQILLEGKWWDLLYAYQFLRRLITPFEKTDAFKLGIIDKDGNNLIKRKDFTNDDQKNAYTYFNVLIFNLKKLLGKLPFGKTSLASFAAALVLLKEEKNRGFQILQESDNGLVEKEFALIYNELYKNRSVYEHNLLDIQNILMEDMTTSALPTTQQEPVGTKKASKKFIKKKKILRRNPIVENIESHGNFKIFHVDPATFIQAKKGKSRYERYSKYVGSAKLGEQIREYAINNPKMPVILKCEKSGQLCFLKYGSVAANSIKNYYGKN